MGVLKKLNVLPLSISKSFVRHHLDYGDLLNHQPNNASMNSRLDNV